MLLLAILACLPLPAPDFRRPAALVVFKGEPATGLTVKVCTWGTRQSPLEGCDNLAVGQDTVDGVGVPEWSVFPLVLGTESPLWGDAFVACEGDKPRGATLRLPDLQVKWDDKVEIVLDSPSTQWGARPGASVPEDTVQALATGLCAGTMKGKGE
jgi:hypothetical protein